MRKALILLAVLCTIPTVSCRKKEAPAPPPPPKPAVPVEREFSYTNRSEMVSEPEVQARQTQREQSVVADFNADGLKDVAILEDESDGTMDVVIYIQSKDAPPPPDPAQGAATAGGTLAGEAARQYFKAGRIRRPMDGRVTGLATRRTQRYMDLVILFQGPYGSDVIHYRNDGVRFYEVEHEPTEVPPAW